MFDGLWTIRVQTALVAVLFLASLGALLFNTWSSLGLPQRELEARAQVREASRLMVEQAAPILQSLSGATADRVEALHKALHEITSRVLLEFPGIEGGYYLAAGIDRFSAYAYPTGRHGPDFSTPRNDPPPLEAAYIRIQAQQSLSDTPGRPLVIVRDVGPSRVLVVTEPIGSGRPAVAAAWTMFRLTGPEQLHGQVRRYQLSVGFGLLGLVLSLLLLLSLTRSLKRERLDQERLRNELKRSEQLAALGKLLAGVAHEIKNPLAAIRSTVQLWERLPATTKTEDSTKAIIQSVDRLDDILRRLLLFARVESRERRPCEMNRLLSDTFMLLEAQAASHNVRLDLDLQQDLPTVPGSVTMLHQVFLNLVLNALQAMPGGGCLSGRTRYNAQARMVEVTVADTGPGISTEERAHLFQPFFTTKPDGTGLGLALCHEVVQQHGGRIELVSEEGGATFLVSLPVNAEHG